MELSGKTDEGFTVIVCFQTGVVGGVILQVQEGCFEGIIFE